MVLSPKMDSMENEQRNTAETSVEVVAYEYATRGADAAVVAEFAV